jgi:hypothetical protein
VKYGLTFAHRKARELKLWLWWRSRVAFSHLREFNGRFWRIPTVLTSRKILSGFCAEAAVLIAIFPYLDFLIESQHVREASQLSKGASPIDMASVKRQSAMLVAAFLISAVVLAIKTSDEEE